MRFVNPWAWFVFLALAGLVWALRHEWKTRVGLDRAAFVFRILALVVLALAVTWPQVISRQSQRFVYFVIDQSASSSFAGDEAVLLQTLKQFEQSDTQTMYGVIVFGKDAFIDQPFSKALPSAIQTAVNPSGSDLAGALRLALETLPLRRDENARGNVDIVLLSDGQFNSTHARGAGANADAVKAQLAGVLERARRAGVRIWALPVGSYLVNDARIDTLQLPREVTPQRDFEGVAYIHATGAGSGTLLVYRNDALIQALDIAFEPGTTPIRFTDTLHTPGHYRYQVRLRTGEDQFLENNVASDLVTVSGDASVLVFDESQAAGAGLSRLLDVAGFTHERRLFEGQRIHLSDLAKFKAVVLNNIPISGLDDPSIEALKAYVSELGGGLWVIEGQRALAGVNNSPLEELLPVNYEGPQREQLPGVAIVFVLDRSSSMGQTAVNGSGLTKLDVLKEAAASSIEVLREEDWIGVMTFDSAYKEVVPLQPLASQSNREAIYAQLQQVFAGGGTDMLPPLVEAFKQLNALPARIKHILVFSDGKTVRQDRDFESLFEQFSNSDVTISSIGLGMQPDEEILQRLADAGQGQMFLVRDVSELPKISVRETRRIVQRRWVVGEFQIEPGPFAQLRLSGLNIENPPALGGYVRTYAKPLSQTAIQVEGNPLVSFWQYGLGQVAVANTDLEGVWTSAWTQWPQFSGLAAEVITQLYANPVSNTGLVLNSSVEGDTLRLELDALDGSHWVNQLEITGTLLSEDNLAAQGEQAGIEVSFQQVGPGHYEAELPGVAQGLNLLNVEAKHNETLTTQQTHVVAVPYPLEYQNLGINEQTLELVTRSTGGRVLEDERLDLGPLGGATLLQYHDIWPNLLGLSLFLFFGDLLLRKIPLEAWFAQTRTVKGKR